MDMEDNPEGDEAMVMWTRFALPTVHHLFTTHSYLRYSSNHSDDGNDGSSSDRIGASYVTSDCVTRTINSLFTAVLQNERVDEDCGCGVVVEYIAIAMASMSGYAGAKASPMRWMSHEI